MLIAAHSSNCTRNHCLLKHMNYSQNGAIHYYCQGPETAEYEMVWELILWKTNTNYFGNHHDHLPPKAGIDDSSQGQGLWNHSLFISLLCMKKH